MTPAEMLSSLTPAKEPKPAKESKPAKEPKPAKSEISPKRTLPKHNSKKILTLGIVVLLIAALSFVLLSHKPTALEQTNEVVAPEINPPSIPSQSPAEPTRTTAPSTSQSKPMNESLSAEDETNITKAILISLNSCINQGIAAPKNCPIQEKAYLHGEFLGWQLLTTPTLKIISSRGSTFVAQTNFKISDRIKYGKNIHNQFYSLSKKLTIWKVGEEYTLKWN